MRYPRWYIGGFRPGLHHQELAERIAGDLNISRITANLLIRRGVRSPEEGRTFLYPDLRSLHDAFLLLDMDAAVRRLTRALETQEAIAIYGDYDVDGLASAALLHSVLRKTGVDLYHYIPDRLREGYGLNRYAVESIAEKGVTLVVTVDCGISAVSEIAHASSLGMDVIILDHHRPPEELPQAAAVVDPWREGCTYPFKHLSGCGVVFKFVQALLASGVLRSNPSSSQDAPSDAYGEYLDLVALATVADMVPMVGENRILVRFGLERLKDTPRAGLRALLEECGFIPGRDAVNEYHAGFVLAPRLNAAGRLGEAGTALKLLITEDRTEAKSLAERLTLLNSLRQQEENLVIGEALRILETEVPRQGVPPAVVLSGSEWHPGVIGIAASKLVELLWRPTVLISTRTGVGRGSARSVPGLDIFTALMNCREFFLRFGGHAQAAGFDMDPERIPEFRKAFQEIAASALTRDLLCPGIELEEEVSLRDLDLKTVTEIGLLGPFGVANPEPAFMTSGVLCRGARGVGADGCHLKLKLPGGFSAIAFEGSAAYTDVHPGAYMDLAFTVKEGEYGGFRRVEVIAKDIRRHEVIVEVKGKGSGHGGVTGGTIRLIDGRGTVIGVEGLARCLEEARAGCAGAQAGSADEKGRSLIYVSSMGRGLRLLQWLRALGERPALFGLSLKGESRKGVIDAFSRGEIDVLVVYGRPPTDLRNLRPHYIVLWDPPPEPYDFTYLCQTAAGGHGLGSDVAETPTSSAYTPSFVPSVLLAYNPSCPSFAKVRLMRLVAKVPLRRDLVRIFKVLRILDGASFGSRSELEKRVFRRLGIGFAFKGLRRGLRVFEEMGLLCLVEQDEPQNRVYVKIVAEPASPNGKKRLEDCRAYREYLAERRFLQSWFRTIMSDSVEDMVKMAEAGEAVGEKIKAVRAAEPPQENVREEASDG